MNDDAILKQIAEQKRSIQRLQDTVGTMISWITGSSVGVLNQEEAQELYGKLFGTKK